MVRRSAAFISERTKAGLAEAKRRGKKLGGRNAQSDRTAAAAAAFAERIRSDPGRNGGPLGSSGCRHS